ncbi:MAG: hypothetical protein DIU79_00055 [Actinobacteria bacterium]|nr:MAG: hypothetical protein DIU79_00055 [Actinomycetota bacterium]
MATVNPKANATVARLKGVKMAVRDRAQILATRARGLLAQHRATGTAKIQVSRGRVDSFVSLVDPAAISIEWGREAGVSKTGRRYAAQPGLYIMHRTIGLTGGGGD